jgi:chromosomal replication initiator protein
MLRWSGRLACLAPPQNKPTLEGILEVASLYFGTGIVDLIGRGRSAPLALQRQIVMFVMREETGASYPQIGGILGGRDHTTVMHGCEKVAGEINTSPEMSRQVNELRSRLYEPVAVRVR